VGGGVLHGSVNQPRALCIVQGSDCIDTGPLTACSALATAIALTTPAVAGTPPDAVAGVSAVALYELPSITIYPSMHSIQWPGSD